MSEADDKRMLHAFRRSGYAPILRDYLNRRLAEQREAALNNPITERAMGAIDGTKQLMTELFGEDNG